MAESLSRLNVGRSRTEQEQAALEPETWTSGV